MLTSCARDGIDGYTAVIDRTDGHMRSMSAGQGELFEDQPLPPWADWMGPRPYFLSFAPQQIGFMGVIAGDKAVVAKSLPAVVDAPARDGDAVVLRITGAGAVVTYRFEPNRFGISASAPCDLVLKWSASGIDYNVAGRTIYGQVLPETLADASFTAHPFGAKAVFAIQPGGGKMTLADYTRLALGSSPAWISPAPLGPKTACPTSDLRR